MNHHNMRAPLRHRIRAYYELCFPTNRAFNEDEILSELTEPLREACTYHALTPYSPSPSPSLALALALPLPLPLPLALPLALALT
jgi:hypothetical protein